MAVNDWGGRNLSKTWRGRRSIPQQASIHKSPHSRRIRKRCRNIPPMFCVVVQPVIAHTGNKRVPRPKLINRIELSRHLTTNNACSLKLPTALSPFSQQHCDLNSKVQNPRYLSINSQKDRQKTFIRLAQDNLTHLFVNQRSTTTKQSFHTLKFRRSDNGFTPLPLDIGKVQSGPVQSWSGSILVRSAVMTRTSGTEQVGPVRKRLAKAHGFMENKQNPKNTKNLWRNSKIYPLFAS